MNMQQASDVTLRLYRTGCRIARRSRVGAAVFSYLMLGLSPAMAADIDIYTKNVATAAGGAPVILMQIDSSGSMAYELASDNWADYLLEERSYRAVDVARNQVSGLPGTYKVGLMRYKDGGTGQLLMEAAPLAEQVLSAGSAAGGTSVFKLGDDKADADQIRSASNPAAASTFSLSNEQVGNFSVLNLGKTESWTLKRGATGFTSIPGRWPFTYDAAEVPDYPLPPGSGGKVRGNTAGLAGNGVYWYKHTSSSSTSQTIVVRSDTVAPYVCVTNAAGSGYRTGGTCTLGTAGADLTLSLSSLSTSTDSGWSRVIVGTNAPGEVGTYTVTVGTSSRGLLYQELVPAYGNNRTALQFSRIDIPAGATITSASIRVKASIGNTSGAGFVLGIEASPQPLSLAEGLRDPANKGLYSRDIDWLNTSQAEWATNASIGSWSSGSLYDLDVTALVQRQVGRADWCGGDMVFAVERHPAMTAFTNAWQPASLSNNYMRRVYAFDNQAAKAMDGTADNARPAELVVTWTAPATPVTLAACQNRELTLTIGGSSDDVEQGATGVIRYDGETRNSLGAVTGYDRYLTIGSGNRKIGLRFPLVSVPQGAVISEAYLELTSAANATAPVLNIFAADQAQAAPFPGEALALDTLPLTTDTPVTWSPGGWTKDVTYRSPDIASLIQPILDRDDWSYDNAIALIVQGNTATGVRAWAWERHDSDATSGNDALERARYGNYSAVLRLKVRSADGSALPVVQTRRQRLYDEFARMTMGDSTPIAGTLLESAKYMLGESPYTLPPLADGDCATNAIVLLTDGDETGSYSSLSTGVANLMVGAPEVEGGTCSNSGDGRWYCSYKLMSGLFNKRVAASNDKKYSIVTHAVGFGPVAKNDNSMLALSKNYGGGGWYPATDAAELVKKFREIVSSVTAASGSVAAAGVAVNALNKFEHLDELYYALFKPSTSVRWIGNVKRYRLQDSAIVDVAGLSAISGTTGLFATGTRSWWSDAPDNGDVGSGGVGAEILPNARNLYTYFGPYGTGMNVPLRESNPNDRDGVNGDVVLDVNAKIDMYHMGVNQRTDWASLTTTQKSGYRAQAIEYLRGSQNATPNPYIGAVIHSSPSLVTYGQEGTGTSATGINTLFVSDNAGVLRMIDTGDKSGTTAENIANTGGRELFAFVPLELLDNSTLLLENKLRVNDFGHVWGLDGTWVPWKYDVDLDGSVEPADGDKVMIYGGMRRGGKNYYALDVTTVRRDVSNPNPVLKWVIEGGKTGTPYANMGQSWADPSPRWIRWNDERRRVVFFTGGYDAAANDYVTSFSGATQLGRQVYMVDADTGQLLWWASSEGSASTVVANMKYSMPSAPVTMDRNGNGVVDGFYVMDIAGQLFRFDLNEGATSSTNFVRGNAPVLVGNFGPTAPGANATSDNRRFYDAPAVAFVRSSAGGDLMIATTSGDREAPGSTSTDEKVIFIRDVGAWNIVPPPRTTLTFADLAELPETGALPPNDMAKPGWYMDLDRSDGEKGSGSPVFFNFALLFSTYVPKGAITDMECAPAIGISRLYAMNALTGAGIVNSELEYASENQRYLDEAMPGMGSTVQTLYMDGQLTIVSGTLAIATDNEAGNGLEDDDSNLLDPAIFGNIRRTRWFEVNE